MGTDEKISFPTPKKSNHSSLVVLILNNLNISTITTGAKTNPTSSKIFSVGSTGILKIYLSPGINKIANINIAEIATAPINFVLLNTFVLNTDFLLFLRLNTCVSSDNASVTNAMVCPTSIFD